MFLKILISVEETLWFFLPVLVANQCPGFAKKLKLPLINLPISKKWLGKSKTWGAYYAGVIGALMAVYFQQWMNLSVGIIDYSRPDLWLVGLCFGFGTILGDTVKSFIKRRLGIYPGVKWFPFDQLDGVIGGFLLAWPLTGWIGFVHLATMLFLMAYLIHPVGNYLGYRLGLREVPW